MNYGQYETERRLKSLSSKTGKYTSKLVFNIFKAFFILFLFLAVAGAAVGFGMIKGIIDNAPSVDIMNIQPDRFATTVYDADGNLTETLVTSGSNRESATYEELPENLVNAFVAIEDSRFWTHDGIDLRSIARAVKGVVSDDYSGGGSTITQQLIKNNIFSGGMETSWGARIERKLQEQYLAVQLEKNSGLNKEETKKTIITNYLNSIIKVDSVHANSLSLLLIPGFIMGAIICFWWFRWQRWRFRFLISGGMFCYVIYLAILYFGVTPYSTYEMLYLPVFLRGLAMMSLFIAFGVYVVEDLDPKLMLSNAFFLISFRSVLAPAISASFFSNALYHLQMKGINTLSENMVLTNPVTSTRYSQALNNALAQGHGYNEASQIATNSLYAILQQQSLLLGIKTIIGYLLITALTIAIVSAFIPFHKTLKVAVVKTGDDMV